MIMKVIITKIKIVIKMTNAIASVLVIGINMLS